MIMLVGVMGLKRARETVESAATKVTASAETIAKSIGVALGIAVVALVVAFIALVRTRPVTA